MEHGQLGGGQPALRAGEGVAGDRIAAPADRGRPASRTGCRPLLRTPVADPPFGRRIGDSSRASPRSPCPRVQQEETRRGMVFGAVSRLFGVGSEGPAARGRRAQEVVPLPERAASGVGLRPRGAASGAPTKTNAVDPAGRGPCVVRRTGGRPVTEGEASGKQEAARASSNGDVVPPRRTAGGPRGGRGSPLGVGPHPPSSGVGGGTAVGPAPMSRNRIDRGEPQDGSIGAREARCPGREASRAGRGGARDARGAATASQGNLFIPVSSPPGASGVGLRRTVAARRAPPPTDARQRFRQPLTGMPAKSTRSFAGGPGVPQHGLARRPRARPPAGSGPAMPDRVGLRR